MSGVDKRKVVGEKIHAKAMHVTNLSECSRRYGSRAKTKEVAGTVVAINIVPTRNQNNSRTTCMVTADFDLGGGTMKRQELNIRSVKAGEPPPPTATAVTALTAAPAPPDQPTTLVLSPGQAATPPAALTAPTNPSAPPAPPENAPQPPPIIAQPINLMAPAAVPDDVLPQQPVARPHGFDWFINEPAVYRPVNGNVPRKAWRVTNALGDRFSLGSDTENRYSRVDYFLLMFPPAELQLILRLTNLQLRSAGLKETTKGQLLKFFGIIILATRFEFGERASLWSSTAPSKYVPAPNFGRTGMTRPRFDTIWRCIRFSDQPDVRPDTMSSEQHRWRLVDDFVRNFNDHRAETFIPSEKICVDESISRWYGLGGYWINLGLPQYVAIDRKPENGCEIQNSACGDSGVMLRLKLVKTAEAEDHNVQEDESSIPHGAKILRELVQPWVNTERIVCADSYFASVKAARLMLQLGFRFIGVVKTATKQFPMVYLSTVEFAARGDTKAVIANDEHGDYLAFVWMDRERRYFIATAGSMEAGGPYQRTRWRQVNQEENAPPELVEMEIPQPKAAEIYYDTASSIDQHNRCRQDDLSIERKLGTKDWSKRVNLSILGMCVVDSWFVYRGCTGSQESQSDFYTALAEELIDNTFDQAINARRSSAGSTIQAGQSAVSPNGFARAGVGPHLTPTKRKRKNKDGDTLNYLHQGRCAVCSLKTTMVCSLCHDDAEENGGDSAYVCGSKTTRLCFAIHLEEKHGIT